jgi:outer membrane protein OmpA-like peptidoglycan-associated protein
MKRTLTLIAFLVCAVAVSVAQNTMETVVTVTGSILNEQSFMPVECSYSVYGPDGKKMGQTRKASVNEGYLVTGLRSGETYTFKIEDPRYFKREFSVSVPKTSKYQELSKDLVVIPLEAGKKITMRTAPFNFRKTEVREAVQPNVAELAKTLVSNPSVSVELICYPDEVVAIADAQKMSQARGNNLKAALVKAGVSASRISIKVADGTDPLNPPPIKKAAKGKRYVGSVYLVVTRV